MQWNIKTRSKRFSTLLLSVFLIAPVLIYAALLNSGCAGIANVAISTPKIFLSQQSGIHHEVVEFYQFQNDRVILAPPSKVWETLTTISKLPMLYPWMEKIDCPKTDRDTLQLGQSIQYEMMLVGLKKDGTAVVTEMEPEESLGMTMFSKSHGSLYYRLTPENGKTRLTIQLTTMIHDLSMMRPASDVKKALSEDLGQTLKSIALETEGKPMDEKLAAEESRIKVCLETSAPFDVVKGVIVIDLPPDKTWKYFNLTGRNPLFFSKVSKDVPENARNFLGKLGNGIPYNETVGPFQLKGIAVVTSVDPGKAIGLSLFSDLKAGADYQFLAQKDGTTLFSALYYLQIPAEHKGKPVDRNAVLEEMQTMVNREMKAFKLHCEQLAAKDSAS
jgi:uncharacterized protein YndB with AHSA1/START domain